MSRSTGATATGETIAVEQFANIVEATGQAKYEKISQYGAPCTLNALVVNGAAGTQYPDDGSALAQAGAGSSITLAANVSSATEYVGLLITIVAGTGIGQTRKISAYSSVSKVATVSAAWAIVPDATSQYRLLIDCFTYNQVHAKAEYSDNTTEMDVVVVFYDVPPAGRAARQYCDDVQTIRNLAFVADTTHAGYFHGKVWTVAARGALGAKVYIKTITGAGLVDMWGGAA